MYLRNKEQYISYNWDWEPKGQAVQVANRKAEFLCLIAMDADDTERDDLIGENLEAHSIVSD